MFGSSFASPVVGSVLLLNIYAYTYIEVQLSVSDRPTQEREEKKKKKKECIEDYVYCPDRRSPVLFSFALFLSLSFFSFLHNSEGSHHHHHHRRRRRRSEKETYFCSIIIISYFNFLPDYLSYKKSTQT